MYTWLTSDTTLNYAVFFVSAAFFKIVTELEMSGTDVSLAWLSKKTTVAKITKHAKSRLYFYYLYLWSYLHAMHEFC